MPRVAVCVLEAGQGARLEEADLLGVGEVPEVGELSRQQVLRSRFLVASLDLKVSLFALIFLLEFLLHLELALMHDVDISDRIPLCEDDLPTEVLLLAQAPVKVEQARLRVLAEDRDALEELDSLVLDILDDLEH